MTEKEKMLAGEIYNANHNLVILDGNNVKFGDNVFVAPNCAFYTYGHPLDYKERNKGLEYAIQTTERFNAINMVISPLIMYGINTKNPLLLKNVFRIYLKLLENATIRSKLTGDKIPDGLFSKEILMILKNDYELNELHKKIVKILK